MRKRLIGVAMMLACVASSASAVSRQSANTAAADNPTAETLLENRRPELVDYYELRTRLGDAQFNRLRQDVFAEMGRRKPNPPRQAVVNCPSDSEAMVMAMLGVAADTASPQDYAAQVAGARAVLVKLDEARKDLAAGRLPDEIYRPALRYAELSASASNPRVKELFRRATEDQAVAMAVVAIAQNGPMVRGLGRPALGYLQTVSSWENCRLRQENTAWLKHQVAQSGWFRISLYGAEADSAAHLLVQHSDHDRAFQQTVLEELRKLLPTNDARPQSYAQLDDRVAVALNRPQQYGSQGRCLPTGVWEPAPVENPDGLDRRRAAVGLPTMEVYRAGFRCPVIPPATG